MALIGRPTSGNRRSLSEARGRRVLRGELVRSAKDQSKQPPKTKRGTDAGKPGRDVGAALRRAYDETLGESVPDDLLDLLKKLD